MQSPEGLERWRARDDWLTYRATADPPDPAQMPAARDLWHGRLVAPAASIPVRAALAATAVPPLWQAAAFARRRTHRGLCPS